MHRTARLRRLGTGILLLAATLAALHAPAAAEAAPTKHRARYASVALPLDAVALNDKGLVAGTVTQGGLTRAATWHDGRLRVLALPPGATGASVSDVNDRGVVGGDVTGPDGTRHAVLWIDGRPVALSEPEPGDGPAVQSSVSALNERGDAAGAADSGTGWRAAAWRDAVRRGPSAPLTFFGSGSIEGLNERGVSLLTFPGAIGERPLLRCAFSDCATRLQPLPSDQDATVVAEGLNDQRAVGYQYPTFQSDDLSQVRPLWWDAAGRPHGLPSPAGDGAARPREVNSLGDVVGDYQSSPGTFEIVLWSGRAVRLLGVPGRALDLNDKGQVLVRDGADSRLVSRRGR